MVAAMIVGRVNDVGLAEIELLVRGPSGRNLLVTALIDTGFTGDLTLSRGDIDVLLLDVVGTRRGELANGEFVLFTVYRAIANWHGLDQEIAVVESNSDSLVGMSLLQGSRLTIDVTSEGKVSVVPLSS